MVATGAYYKAGWICRGGCNCSLQSWPGTKKAPTKGAVYKRCPALPCPALPCQALPSLDHSLLRAAESLERLRAAVCNCCRAQPSHAPPCLATPCPASLGLTPKDAQYNQATAASIRLRLSAGITSASNRPCLGLQSPSPTSLPASAAISATSPMFSTSGSY